ncbi:DUF1616 domain-containing protein [Methanospirillum lacunae]|uniref:DUF1616 domain-containing protein n=1 Tax=Methanospirillum lacunae TaxID=668570 RepID=A0A2V2N8X3_9EURY|nr:DUF1616 domain-containing protein [Methanospirillum lacunae]PWR72747.1 hypothetical protein DK846_07290 [Methanospirillum lacunae]
MGILQPRDPWYEKIFVAFFEEKMFPDIKLILLWLFFTCVVIYLPLINTSPVRPFVALPMILFIPGYTLIAALFPDRNDIDMIERVALSFGLSIAVVPLIGLGLNYTPWGIRLDPIVISLIIFTIAMLCIAQYRRVLLPVEQRLTIPFHIVIREFKNEFFSAESSRLDRILSIILLIAIIGAIGTTIYVILVPKEGEKFSEFFILGEKKMAADYPNVLFTGTEYPMFIGVGNHEYRNVTYMIETYLVNMQFNDQTNTSTINRMDRQNQIPVFLAHNETTILPYNLTTSQTGYNRVEFLLFNETIPSDSVTGFDRINASYRDLHLWVKTQVP